MSWIGPAITLAAKAAPAIIAAIPGSAENKYLKRIKADMARVARTGGGMTQGQLSGYQATAQGAIDANRNTQLAELARSSGMGQGQSGAQQAALKAINTAADQGATRAASDIRAQDVALGAQTTAGLDARLAQARAMGAERKAQALSHWKNAVSPAETEGAFNTGQGQRSSLGALIDSARKGLPQATGQGTEADLIALATTKAAELGIPPRGANESPAAFFDRVNKAILAKQGAPATVTPTP
jgi:hypothetical protein